MQRSLSRGKVDGILFFSMKFPEKYVDLILQRKVPMVLVDTYHSKFDSISVNNIKGAYIATEYLIKLGHRRIGMITARLESTPAKQRFKGFKKALSWYGVKFREEYFIETEDKRLDGFNREAGYQSAKKLLSLNKKIPTAIFVSSDVQAVGVIQALEEAGIKVPDDVSVIGFDDIELAKDFGLTTVRQPMYHMGVLAVERLFERIEKPELEPKHFKFTPELVVRRTCRSLK